MRIKKTPASIAVSFIFLIILLTSPLLRVSAADFHVPLFQRHLHVLSTARSRENLQLANNKILLLLLLMPSPKLLASLLLSPFLPMLLLSVNLLSKLIAENTFTSENETEQRCSVQDISLSRRMGCTSSISKRYSIGRKKKLNIPEILVFTPTLRIPANSDLVRPLRGRVSQEIVEKLFAFRSRILLLAEQCIRSAFSELHQALQEYLPFLLALTKKEYGLEELVEFKWKCLEDDQKETCIASSWYELLSVVHMMAMLSLSEANNILISKDVTDTDCRTAAIDLLLKASGYLEYCVRHILVCMPPNIKMMLPRDLREGVLEAISFEALGQGTEMQLGLAIESQKATLSVKRRLACEQVSYFAKAHYCMSGCIREGYGRKHILFIKWKYLEAKAAAYYYHGLILDKGNEPRDHIRAVCCLLAAEELLIDSKRACLSFCIQAPVTRASPLWGVIKHLNQKIPELASKKSQIYAYLFEEDNSTFNYIQQFVTRLNRISINNLRLGAQVGFV
ncbi:BRO1 domain-containing protein BROX [Cinnamomum micranthum f. kanehirae]|uniref:BRO1 domain-containing protein BROX n=1 Tax=Cinnamomum micranthum f. kanehirae TaxID=337451 RepID=A0A3S3MHJ8_9MAGN|nr:BRO1 domain-containing protein BROX [Cinnamomum micranthum f. kanehirae]